MALSAQIESEVRHARFFIQTGKKGGELDLVINAIKEIPGVIQVERSPGVYPILARVHGFTSDEIHDAQDEIANVPGIIWKPAILFTDKKKTQRPQR